MNNLAEVMEPEASAMDQEYGLEQAGRDAKALHKLQRKAKLEVGMVDKEIEAVQQELAVLEARRKEILEPMEDEMAYLESNLTAYHRQQLEQGGDKTIRLPWATLKSQKNPQGYIKDDGMLLEWAQSNAAEYVKVAEPTVAWGELKKQLVVAGDKVMLKETGEVVEGLEPKPIETSFKVEVL